MFLIIVKIMSRNPDMYTLTGYITLFSTLSVALLWICVNLEHLTSTIPHPFQDFSQTPSHQNKARVRVFQDPTSTPSSSDYSSVASSISRWEQRFPVDSGSQNRFTGTPQCRSRTPATCHSTSSVGHRRGQRRAPGTEVPATTLVYGLDLEAGTRVSVC